LGAERVERRLAAILAADVAGYSRLMERDEVGTLARLRNLRRDLIDPKIAEHKGRIVKTTGDGILIEFPSVVEAVACAVAMQRGMAARNDATAEAECIQFRVGINSGDVIVEDGDIHGGGVNIAARLEGIAEPGGICISAIVYDQVQGRLECTFEDIGERSLKNIVRPVRVYRIRPEGPRPSPPPRAGEGTGAQVGAEPALALPDKPSIAVLPFQNMSADPEQEYFADGMVEEIITALSRIRWLFVIARNSTFTYKGQAIDIKRVGRELGVRYVLEGSVRKGGGRVRITAQLIEAETGAHLWADRFDGSLEDVFELQEQVATGVAGVIEPTLQAAESARSASRPTSDLSAYDAYLRAYAMYSGSHQRQFRQALALLEEAIARDPQYGPALGFAALCCMQLASDASDPDRDAIRHKGIDFGRRALEVAENAPGVLADAAYALACFGEDIDAMIVLVEADNVPRTDPAIDDGGGSGARFCLPRRRAVRHQVRGQRSLGIPSRRRRADSHPRRHCDPGNRLRRRATQVFRAPRRNAGCQSAGCMAPLLLVGEHDLDARHTLSQRGYRARCRRSADGRVQAGISGGPRRSWRPARY